MAGPASPLDVPLHAHIGILAQRRRGLLRQAHEAAIEARHLPIGRRLASSNQSLCRRTQRGTKTLHLDRRPRQNHCCCQTRAPNVRFDPLAHHKFVPQRSWSVQRSQVFTFLVSLKLVRHSRTTRESRYSPTRLSCTICANCGPPRELVRIPSSVPGRHMRRNHRPSSSVSRGFF